MTKHNKNSPSNASQLDLWQRFVQGDKKAFSKLYQPFHKSLTMYCLGKLKNFEDAEDVAAQTLMKLWQYPNPKQIRNFQHWLFKVACNECLNYLNKHKRRRKILDGLKPFMQKKQDPSGEQEVIKKEMLAFVQKHLSGKEYDIWQLDRQGYNNEEITEQLKAKYQPPPKVKTVANLKSIAKNKLKKVFEKWHIS